MSECPESRDIGGAFTGGWWVGFVEAELAEPSAFVLDSAGYRESMPSCYAKSRWWSAARTQVGDKSEGLDG